MNLFVKLMFAALFIAILLPFTILKGKDGRPLMSFSDLKMPSISLPKIPDSKPATSISQEMAGKDIIYQWRDAEGNVNFTTEQPPAGIEYSVKGYDPRTNLIQSVQLEEEPDVSNSDSEQNNSAPVQQPSDIGNPYSPAKVEKLFNDAKNVEKLLNDRMKQQEAMIGQ